MTGFERYMIGEEGMIMILRRPSYYEQFHCIANRCKDSCCIGWEIDIDEDTFAYYKSVEGPFGERLRKNIASEQEHTFVLNKNGWCPFLNKEKLCDICIELSEEALSEVCTEYPRFTTEYANVREKALCLSCEEVGRILFSNKEKTKFKEQIIFPGYEEEISAEERKLSERLLAARTEAIHILQNRDMAIRERMIRYLDCCSRMQVEIFGGSQTEKMPYCGNPYEEFVSRMAQYDQLEVLDCEWTQVKEQLRSFYRADNYEKYHAQFLEYSKGRAYEYEHLLVYFTFRYFMGAFYDDNIIGKAKFAVASVLMINDMDVVRYFSGNQSFTLKDRIDTARIYAKEVEHSEENMELLADAFVFENVFSLEAMQEQVLHTM